MKWSVKFQRGQGGPWEHAPILEDSSDAAWEAWARWRVTSNTEVLSVSVQPIDESTTTPRPGESG